jgi:peptide deformylase
MDKEKEQVNYAFTPSVEEAEAIKSKSEEKTTPPEVKVEPDKELEKLLEHLVSPHKKVSREVTEKDIAKIVADSQVMHALCFAPTGLYRGAYAIHHSQIDDKEPLSFFVTWDKKIVINPKIVRHTNQLVDSKEACMTFPTREQIIVPRWHKLEVEYVTVMLDPDSKNFKLSSPIQESLSGHTAFEWQHESDHGQGFYIYPF